MPTVISVFRPLLDVRAIALLFLFAYPLSAQTCPGSAGCLDPSFGSGGIEYVTGLGTGNLSQADMVIQSDGKVVALVYGTATNATIIRLNPDGTLDATFAGDGILETNWHYNPTLPRGYPNGLAIQVIGGEERFVVAGSWSVPAGRNTQYTYLRVDRYRSDGSVDTTFGPSATGSVILNKPIANAVAIQPLDNKIVTAGSNAVVRLNEDGTLDTTFGQNGEGATGAGQFAFSVKALSDGSILIGGTYLQNSQGDLMCVTRLNYNGSVFESFGNAGRAIANFYGRGSAGRANQIDIDPFGNIIAGGWARPKNGAPADFKFAAARFTPSGQLDSSFNGTGMATYSFAGLGDSGRSIVAQSDGRMIVTGQAKILTGDSADFGAVRFNYNGTVDTTFGSGGHTTTNIDRSDYSSSAALWTDPACSCQKLILAGASYTGASFARYTTQ